MSRPADTKAAANRATSSTASGTTTPTFDFNRSSNLMSRMGTTFDQSRELESSRQGNRSLSPCPTVNGAIASSDTGSRQMMRSAMGYDWDLGCARNLNPPSPRPASSAMSSLRNSPQRSTSNFELSLPLSADQRSTLFNNLSVTPRRMCATAVSSTSPDDSTASVLNQSQGIPPPHASRYSMLRICENLPRQVYARRPH
jgi:hypothetical protein